VARTITSGWPKPGLSRGRPNRNSTRGHCHGDRTRIELPSAATSMGRRELAVAVTTGRLSATDLSLPFFKPLPREASIQITLRPAMASTRKGEEVSKSLTGRWACTSLEGVVAEVVVATEWRDWVRLWAPACPAAVTLRL
jgi:hypothetical protein